ncbi:unnamed protein product [Dracunculus medinensis]|uniref:Uncharacterized protein n=1 Tax=Dracunculus medinensis TaxID=318479 RepID=A0A0N4U0X1_DRAME|nr:unnamed protein product [Dracunculus medinensis]
MNSDDSEIDDDEDDELFSNSIASNNSEGETAKARDLTSKNESQLPSINSFDPMRLDPFRLFLNRNLNSALQSGFNPVHQATAMSLHQHLTVPSISCQSLQSPSSHALSSLPLQQQKFQQNRTQQQQITNQPHQQQTTSNKRSKLLIDEILNLKSSCPDKRSSINENSDDDGNLLDQKNADKGDKGEKDGGSIENNFVEK